MHTLLPLLLALVLATPVHAQHPLDAANGFLDFLLGDTLAHFQHLQPRGKYEKKDVYISSTLDLTYGGIRFQQVQLLFYKNRLHSIRCRTTDKPSSLQFLDLLQALYGTGTKDGFAPRYTWNGDRVELLYDQNLLTGTADVTFTSSAVEATFRREWVRFGP
jgi:hypothetical protein